MRREVHDQHRWEATDSVDQVDGDVDTGYLPVMLHGDSALGTERISGGFLRVSVLQQFGGGRPCAGLPAQGVRDDVTFSLEADRAVFRPPPPTITSKVYVLSFTK
jgi:hypothetical protein